MTRDFIVLERIWPPASAPAGWLCHLGGWPNLPASVPWPRVTFPDGTSAALDFLAQIDLAAVPEVYERGLLPRHGMLYFFAVGETSEPLAALGAGAWKVIYRPDSAAGVPPRPPPGDAGWGQQQIDYARGDAPVLRDPEAPRDALYPYCPVQPRRAVASENGEGDAPPRRSGFAYKPHELPLRVEDALLHLNAARNSCFENIVPFPVYLDHLRARAKGSRDDVPRLRPGQKPPPPRPPAPWVTYVLSADGLCDFAADYTLWRGRAAAMAAELRALGGSTPLTAAQRTRVFALVEQTSALHLRVTGQRLHMPIAAGLAQASLTTLLLHDPGLAARCPDEVAAAKPAADHPHRMLGPNRAVQQGTMGGAETFLLLQLESDSWGPRFMWWDAGNLTFWLSVRDAASRNFDAVRAEIEGH